MKKLIFYFILALSNFALWFFMVATTIQTLYQTFLFLTFISFTCSTFYMIIATIYEIQFHRCKHNQEHLHSLNQNKFYKLVFERLFKYIFTLSMTVCIGYWTLCLGGEQIMIIVNPISINIYLHLFIGVQLVIDAILTKRNHHAHLFVFDFIIFTILIAVYGIILILSAKQWNLTIYPFLNLEITQIILILFYLCLISFNSYQALHYFIGTSNKSRNIVLDSKLYLTTENLTNYHSNNS
jgi:hypothetical protein